VALEKSTVIFPESLPAHLAARAPGRVNPFDLQIPADGINLEKVIGEIERDLLLKALDRAGGVKKRAAELLNVSFRSFRYRLEKYGIETVGGDDEDEY
jgi:two-component system response regulator PilR (NtrC family)